MELTERQAHVLHDLKLYGGWARPMDVGGRGGTHHSVTLHQLWKKGLVDRKPRRTHNNIGRCEDHAVSYVYRVRQ